MDRRRFLTRVGVAASPFVAGCSGVPGIGGVVDDGPSTPTPTDTATEPSGPDRVVRVYSNGVSPTFVGIDVGDTVEWVNMDQFTHELAATKFNENAEDWEFGPHELDSGESVTRTFEAEGQYEYYGTREGEDSLCGAVTVEIALGNPLPCE